MWLSAKRSREKTYHKSEGVVFENQQKFLSLHWNSNGLDHTTGRDVLVLCMILLVHLAPFLWLLVPMKKASSTYPELYF